MKCRIPRSVLQGNYIPHYDKYPCCLFEKQQSIINHSFNMFSRKGGIETQERKKCCKQLKVIYMMLTFCGEPHPHLLTYYSYLHSTLEGMHQNTKLHLHGGQRIVLKQLSRLHNHQFSSEIPLWEMHIVSSKFPLANFKAATLFISKFL